MWVEYHEVFKNKSGQLPPYHGPERDRKINSPDNPNFSKYGVANLIFLYHVKDKKLVLDLDCGTGGHWNRFAVNKVFIEQSTSEPKVKAFIPMYERSIDGTRLSVTSAINHWMSLGREMFSSSVPLATDDSLDRPPRKRYGF